MRIQRWPRRCTRRHWPPTNGPSTASISKSSIAACGAQPRQAACVIHLHVELDGLAADLAVLDVLRRPGAQIHERLEGLTAIGTVHGLKTATAAIGTLGSFSGTRLEHRLEPVKRIDAGGIGGRHARRTRQTRR